MKKLYLLFSLNIILSLKLDNLEVLVYNLITYNKQRRREMPKIGVCEYCSGEQVKVWFNRKIKKNMCRNCRESIDYYDTTKWKACFICSRVRNVAIKKDGNPICQNCYRDLFLPKRVCSRCGKLSQLSRYKGGEPMCNTCRGKIRMKDESAFERCASCSEKKAVASRTLEGQAICYSCYVLGFRD